MTHKKVDWHRIRILEYGIEVEKIRSEWLQDLLDETGLNKKTE